MSDAHTTVPVVPGLTGLTVLARGGYATVYRAVQESVGRDVAVKVENRPLENEHDQRRFLREARAAGRMSGHPNVIDLFDAGMTANGHPYLIMELCEASYADRMKNNPLSAVEARDVGVKIADALADAHALGVLHRDVKPANLLMSRFGEPQLADFGLAVLAETRDHSITLDVLTPAYAPPEMFRFAPPSPAADVYALCATLYALMHGRPARWRGDATPSLVSMVEMFAEPIVDVPGTPPSMMALLRAGMANDEQQRPTAVQLRDALLVLDLDPGSSALPLSRRPAFGPPSWGPSESVSPATTPMSGAYANWRRPPADAPVDDNEATRPRPTDDDPTGPPAGPTASGPTGPTAFTGPGASASARPGASTSAGAAGQADGASAPAGGVPGVPGAPRVAGRRWIWLGLVTGCVALLALFGVVGLGSAGHRTHRAGLPQAPASPVGRSPSQRPSGTAGGGCSLAAASPTLRCATAPECFGPMAVTDGVATAATTSCDRPHDWEVFALDTLPAGVTGLDYWKIKSDGYVRSVCSDTTLAQVDFQPYAWRVAVLPPTPAAFRGGDRTFRCVAGAQSGTTTGAKFVRG